MTLNKLVADTFNLLTTEPKALIIYWMLSNEGPFSRGDIVGGIHNDFGFVLGEYKCLSSFSIFSYLNKRSLRKILDNEDTVLKNSRSGSTNVGGYRIKLDLPPGLKHLKKNAGHALYSSSALSIGLDRPFTINDVLSRNSAKIELGTGAPGHVVQIFDYLRDGNLVPVQEMQEELVGFGRHRTVVHLLRYEQKGMLELTFKGDRYWKRETVTSQEIRAAKRRRNPNEIDQILDYLKSRGTAGSTAEGILQHIIYGEEVENPFLKLNRLLLYLETKRVLRRNLDSTKLTPESQITAAIFSEPILYGIPGVKSSRGTTRLLKTPSREEVQRAIQNYETRKQPRTA